MKELILDLRMVESDDDIVDHPARIELENLLFDYMGKRIRVKVTVLRKQPVALSSP